MRIQDKKRLLYVDNDSENRTLPQGACRYLLNSRTLSTTDSSKGTSENVKQNVLIPNSLLPGGINTCIGTYADNQSNTIFYFHHNSNSNHSIFRYYPATDRIDTILISDILNFDKNKLITSINLIDVLLYWTDNFNPPRKINITKANNTGKFFVDNVYFPIEVAGTKPAYTVSIVVDGSTISATFNPAGFGDLEGTAAEFARLINNDPTLNPYIEAASCGIFTSITSKTAETHYDLSVLLTGDLWNQFPLTIVADNYYPEPLSSDFFLQRIKYPLSYNPSAIIKEDLTRKSNLIASKVFQFRTQVVYDDYEKTVWSAISPIAEQPFSCGGSNFSNKFNYIEVDYSEARIENSSDLSIIRGINIAVREGNTGLWRTVTQLTRAQVISNSNKFKFYNDGIYTTIDVTEINEPFDSVGQLVQSSEIIDDRLFDGGITEGYDNVCVDAELGVTYADALKSVVKGTPIQGRILIKNIFADKTAFMNQQPIHNNGTGIGFGGFQRKVGDDYQSGYITTFKQALPLGGFVMYLAGTTHYAISTQQQGANLSPQNNGIYDSGLKSYRENICTEVENENCFSNFTIPNVPPGKYILRCASHLLPVETDFTNLDYQKTSTYVLNIAGQSGQFECPLEVFENGDIVIAGVVYGENSFVTIHDSWGREKQIHINAEIPATAIADLIQPHRINLGTTALSGYVCDNDNPTATGVSILNDTRIHLAKLILNQSSPNYNSALSTNFPEWFYNKSYTDHNGFFFYAINQNPGGGLQVASITSGTYTLNEAICNIDGGGWANPANNAQIGIFRNQNASVQLYSRTVFNGSTRFNGQALSDIIILSSHGGIDTSDELGQFNMYIYANTHDASSLRADNIYYYSAGLCIVTFTPNIVYYNIAINASASGQTIFDSPFGGNYNSITANQLLLPDVLIVVFGSSTSSSLKRGGKYQLGLVYFDDADRKTFVSNNDQLDLSIPFYTQIPVGETAVIGKAQPIVSWDIKNLPPAWATHYQWVRTLNGAQGRYLQWTADTISYQTDTGAAATFSSGTQTVISLTNTLTYKKAHADSLVSYQFEEGDRIVFIKDSAGNFFNDYYDFKVKGIVDGSPLKIYIDNLVALGELFAGTLFEIYNPKKVATDNLFYEIGECFPITTNKSGTKVHGGRSVNQEYWSFYDNFFESGNVGFVSDQEHDFVAGDIIHINQAPGYVVEAYNGEHEILSVTPTTIVLKNVPFAASTPLNPGTVNRYASGTFINGDTWNRNRKIPNATGQGNDPAGIILAIEDASISDFYVSADQSIGRANVINENGGRIFRPAVIRFSNKYIPGTKINGLSTFRSLNEKSLSNTYGLIQRLVKSRDVLLAICDNSELVSMYVGKALLNDNVGQQLVAISEQVIQNTYQYQGSIGTQHPESVTSDDDGNVYGFDSNKGIVWKRILNGIQPISEVDNRGYFKNKATEIQSKNYPVRVLGVYDRLYNQYILTFDMVRYSPDFINQKRVPTDDSGQNFEYVPFAISDYPCYDNTFAFNEKGNKWESYYTYFPEFYGTTRNNIMISFFDGQLWKHEQEGGYNKFYGVQMPQRAIVVANGTPSDMKRFLDITLESNKAWSVPSIKTPSGQESSLEETDFEFYENVHRADILKDFNTPNVSTPIIFGDDLLGETLEVTIENSNNDYTKIYAVNLYSIISNQTNK